MPGQAPSFVSTSLWQIPQACTLMRTCPASGLGISRSTIWKSAPGLGTCATFIGATANLVLAINPPFAKTLEISIPNDSKGRELFLPRDLENNFQLDRCAERKACDAIYQAARVLVFSEDVLQQLRSAVGDFRLFADIAHRGH